jgi:hypothetical protein
VNETLFTAYPFPTRSRKLLGTTTQFEEFYNASLVNQETLMLYPDFVLYRIVLV